MTHTTINNLIEDYEFKLTGTPKHWENTPEKNLLLANLNQQLLDLFRDMTLEVIGRGSHTRKEDLSTYGFIEQEAVNKRLAAQRKALALKLKEISGE